MIALAGVGASISSARIAANAMIPGIGCFKSATRQRGSGPLMGAEDLLVPLHYGQNLNAAFCAGFAILSAPLR
jgi:hypothetical protein